MVSISKKSKQLLAAAGLALGIIALGACSGGGGSISNPIQPPNQPPASTQGGNWSGTLSSAGMSANLPSVAGFSETLTVPANNAAAGTTLTVNISGSVPSGLPAIDPDLHLVKSFLYFTVSVSKSVTLNGFPGFKLVAPAHYDYGNFPVKIAYYDPKTGWTHVGNMTYSSGILTFVPTTTHVALVANTKYYVIPYTCGGPSPSPTPTGVISCTASGTGAVGVLCISNHTYAFAGTGRSNGSTVVQLDISGGAKNSTAPPTHTYTTSFHPTKCNADSKHAVVFCAGDDSAEMTDINATAQTSADFSSGATTTLFFSGGSCFVCAIAYDPIDNKFIIEDATAAGGGQFQRMGEASPHTVDMSILTSDPNENPGYDYVKNWIFNPGYSSDHLQVLDFGTGKAFTTTGAVTGVEPDSASVDVSTHVAETPDEFDRVAYLADLGTATMSGSTLTVSTGSTTITSTSLISGLGIDASADDSVLHLTFFTGEFGTTSLGFALLPTTSTGTTFSDWAFAAFPTAPDGSSFSAGVDPHQDAAFNDPINCPDCAAVVNAASTWLAVIDLNKLMHAPRSVTDSHSIDPTYDLVANHVVGFYKI
jgi:hypothetical protein